MAAPTRPAPGTPIASAYDPLLVAVCTLGLAQITAWGTSYYCLGVLANPIADDTGWSRSFIYAGFTLALLVMGAVSPWIGRAIDRYGGRRLMAIGTLTVSAGLLALSTVTSQATYLAVWVVLGIGMRLSLYDAAFAALVQVVPSRGRLAISYLTLFGAFASTVFWVLGHFLDVALGWRTTLVLFAAINLAVCLPLNWIGLSRREPREPDEQARQTGAAREGPPLQGRARTIAMVLYGLVMSLNALVFGVISLQLVQLLEGTGLVTAVAVWVASMKGFAQFGGRVLELAFARKLRAITVARIALGILPFAFALLLIAPGSLPAVIGFTVLIGASQGVVTIVRGALPLALFGAAGYGAVLGLLAAPILVVSALAPTLFAFVVDRWNWHSAQIALLGTSSASWLAIELMARWHDRHRARADGRAQ